MKTCQKCINYETWPNIYRATLYWIGVVVVGSGANEEKRALHRPLERGAHAELTHSSHQAYAYLVKLVFIAFRITHKRKERASLLMFTLRSLVVPRQYQCPYAKVLSGPG